MRFLMCFLNLSEIHGVHESAHDTRVMAFVWRLLLRSRQVAIECSNKSTLLDPIECPTTNGWGNHSIKGVKLQLLYAFVVSL